MNYQARASAAALRSEFRRVAGVRHKCFVSYHHEDDDEVAAFIDRFSDVFVARALGVSNGDTDLINSTRPDYVMRRIRELYLRDSTVTIVMIGACTSARRYVDWEIASSLRDDTNNKRSGLMAIELPSVSSKRRLLPPRLQANVFANQEGYGRFWKCPATKTGLENCIEDAFHARRDTSRVATIDNSLDLFKNNRKCP